MTSSVLVQTSPTLERSPSRRSFTRPNSNESLSHPPSSEELDESLATLITQIANVNFGKKDASPKTLAECCQKLHQATQRIDDTTLTTAIWRAWPQPTEHAFREQLWPDLIPCSGYLSMFLTDYVKKQETGGNPVDAIDAVDSILNLINTIRALGQSGYTPLTPISLFKLKKEPEFEAFKRYHLTFLNEHFTDEQVFQFLATVPQKKYFQKELYGQIVQFAMHDIAFVSSLPSIPEHLQQFIKNTLVQERVSVLCGNSNASTYERMRDLFRTISQQSVFHPSQNQRLHKCIRRLTFQN